MAHPGKLWGQHFQVQRGHLWSRATTWLLSSVNWVSTMTTLEKITVRLVEEW